MDAWIYAVNAAVIAAVVVPGLAVGQSTSKESTKTTLCELVTSPGALSGKTVQFRSEFVSKFQWEGFVDEKCSARLQSGAFHPIDDLKPERGEYAFTTPSDDNTHPERLTWKPIPMIVPIQLKQDDDYRMLRKFAGKKLKWPDGGVCVDCPLYRTIVTATGRFDHFETDTVAVRADSSTKAFHYSGLDVPLSRLVLQSLTDVSALSIDASVYSANKPRNVSLEEAHDLVLIASGCIDGSCFLVPYHPDSHFYGFQGVWKHPPGASVNRGYFVVDPKTAEVWSGVVCELYASRSLVNRQGAIRKRIGLIDEAYQRMRKRGPFCEEDEKPRVSRER